jgi:hypothetical protein
VWTGAVAGRWRGGASRVFVRPFQTISRGPALVKHNLPLIGLFRHMG